MIKLRSIKAKSIVFTVAVVLVPMLILGAAGSLYYQGVIKIDIQNDILKDARMVSELTGSFLDRAIFYIEGQADATPLINAIDRRDTAMLDGQMERITSSTGIFYWTYVTDTDGNIMSSHPYGSIVGANISGTPVFNGAMKSGKTYVSSPTPVELTGKPSVILATPIWKNGVITGILCGALNDYSYIDLLNSAMSTTPSETKYIVNRTGQIFVHDNKGYMRKVYNFSGLPIVQHALSGEEGTMEYTDQTSGERWLGAYAPVSRYGFGVITARPLDIAYRPVRDAILTFLMALAALTLVLIGAAILVGNYITGPIVRMSNAAEDVSKTGNFTDLSKYLPYDREDELGGLARAFRDMADRISTAREKIMGEKKRADMYIDVMGHDINNLNQAILSHLEIIKHYDQLNPQQKECLDGAILATRDSAAIIRNVKAIQSVAIEQPEMRKEDLDQIIRECIREAPQPPDKKVTIHYTPRKGMIVEAFPSIKLAFCNVIRNSIKYSGPEVQVDIDVNEEMRDSRKYYVTTITDNGIGIPEENKKTLLTRFQQGSAVLPGKGLGLYAAKVLIEHSGGSIRMENRVPEDYKKGTRVIILLPAAEATEE